MKFFFHVENSRSFRLIKLGNGDSCHSAYDAANVLFSNMLEFNAASFPQFCIKFQFFL